MFHSIFSLFDTFVSTLQTWLYIDIVQPFLFKVGLMGYDEDTYDALYWVIVGVLILRPPRPPGRARHGTRPRRG